jgi:glycosyltransferase 2 family protein
LPEGFPGRQKIIEFTNVYFRFITAWKQTGLAAAASVVMLLAHFSTFYLGARSLGLRLPVGEFFALMPAVDLIAALPISLGGFGVREQLFVTVAGKLWGLPATQAVSVSLVGATLSLLWGLLGLVLLPGYNKGVSKTAKR